MGTGVGLHGSITLTQTLTFCSCTPYNFSAWVGYWDNYNSAVFDTTITVYLDDVVIIPTQLTCSSFEDCNAPGAKDLVQLGYRQIQATFTTPAETSGVLKFVFDLGSTIEGITAIYASLLDDVTLTQV